MFEKNNGPDIKRSSFIISSYNKPLTKTSRNQKKKSPNSINKGKIKNKGNLTDRVIVNKTKISKNNSEQLKGNNSYRKSIGYLTQRELTHFQIREKTRKFCKKIKNSKNKPRRQIKYSSSFNTNNNKCINKLNNKIKNNNHQNKHIIKENNKESSKEKIKTNLNKDNNINKKNKLIDKFYQNLILVELRDISNYIYTNYGNTIEFNKFGGNPNQIVNFHSLIKLKNPFIS
jgi:hypothetical protein